MKRPLESGRPIGPFAQGPFDTDGKDKAVVEFTIDEDSLDQDIEGMAKLDEAKDEVLSMIAPRFKDFDIERTRTGDFKITIDVTDAELGDISWLERQIDEAEEERDLDIYNVKVDVA